MVILWDNVMDDNLKYKLQLIHLRDEYSRQLKEAWGVGPSKSNQAKRLEDGDIRLETDIHAIRVLAMIVNTQFILDNVELKELEGV